MSCLKVLRVICLMAVCLALQGCVFKKARVETEKYVNTFHQRFNELQFTDIYASSTSGFKSTSSQADFVKFMAAVRQKLGAYQSSTRRSWRVNAGLKQTVAVIEYDSTFVRGKGLETFVIVVSGNSAAIQGYHIDSTALITN